MLKVKYPIKRHVCINFRVAVSVIQWEVSSSVVQFTCCVFKNPFFLYHPGLPTSSSELWLGSSPPFVRRRSGGCSVAVALARPAAATLAEWETKHEAPHQAVEQRADTRTSALSLRSAILEPRSGLYECFLLI